MSLRIRQLEEALEILQDVHPLLSEDLLRIKFGSEILNAPHQSVEPNVQTTIEESVDALGTLTLNEEGDIKYFGRSGGLEVRFFPAIGIFNLLIQTHRHCLWYVSLVSHSFWALTYLGLVRLEKNTRRLPL